MIVILDIDDVLMPWAETVHQACMAAGLTSKPTWSQWNMVEDYGCTMEQWLEVVNGLAVPGGMYHVPPYPGTAEAVQKLWLGGADIYAVTARGFFSHRELIRKWTQEWIDQYFPSIGEVTFAENKGEVAKEIRATHAIDDRVENAYSMMNAGVDVYLQNQPHNLEFDFDPYRRVDSVPEFVDKVLANG